MEVTMKQKAPKLKNWFIQVRAHIKTRPDLKLGTFCTYSGLSHGHFTRLCNGSSDTVSYDLLTNIYKSAKKAGFKGDDPTKFLTGKRS